MGGRAPHNPIQGARLGTRAHAAGAAPAARACCRDCAREARERHFTVRIPSGSNAGKGRSTASNSSQEETMPARRAKHPVATLVAAAALSVAASAAFAQDKTFELKLSHWVPPTHPLQKAMEEWGASVE